jgi:lysozyme family protein
VQTIADELRDIADRLELEQLVQSGRPRIGFDQAFDVLIKHEGGYVDHPSDPGGRTNYGISQRAYPGEDIRNMTIERAKQIYKRDYWDACRCDDLRGDIGFHVFDAAVNSGVRRASLWLQAAVGATPDGKIGPRTIAAANAMDPSDVVRMICGIRLRFMTDLSTWQSFGRGWARRIANNLTL